MVSRALKIRPITQEHPMGCGVACTASVLGITYKKALKLFPNYEDAWGNGFYCLDIINVFKKYNLEMSFKKFKSEKDKALLNEGIIAFVKPSKTYPCGHYLVKARNSWMNPWINYPYIKPAKSGFQKKLPGKLEWIIFEK